MKTRTYKCAKCDQPKLESLLFCAAHLKEEYERYDKQSVDNGWEKAPSAAPHHTPTPWTVLPDGQLGRVIEMSNYLNMCPSNHIDLVADLNKESRYFEGNAEFIVRAVNSHDKLLTDLKTAYEALTTLDLFPYNHPMLVNMRASIEQAERGTL